MGAGRLGTPDDFFLDTSRRQLAAMAQVQQLLALDDMWTAYLQAARAEVLTDVPFEGLQGIAADMRLLLETLAPTAGEVRGALDRHSDEAINHLLVEVRESQPSAAGLLDWLLAGGFDGISPRETLMRACDELQAETPAEIEILASKADLLARGELPDPDLRLSFRCLSTLVGVGAFAALAAAGAVTVIGVIPAAALGVLGGAGGLADAWDRGKCSEKPKKK